MNRKILLVLIGFVALGAVWAQQVPDLKDPITFIKPEWREVLQPTPAWVVQQFPTPEGLPVNDIELGKIVYNGSGCRPQTVTATMTPDKKQIAVLFSNYDARVEDGEESDIADCNIAIPINVPNGISVGIVGMTWRGTVRASRDGGLVELYREYFFTGEEGPIRLNQWQDGETERFILEDIVPFAKIVWSGCEGQQYIARADTEAYAEGERSQIKIRAADITGSLIFYLAFKECDR